MVTSYNKSISSKRRKKHDKSRIYSEAVTVYQNIETSMASLKKQNGGTKVSKLLRGIRIFSY